MGAYKHGYRIFNIILGVLIIIAYFVLEYYVIPDFVIPEKKAMAASYTSYGLSGTLFLLGVGSMIAEHFDEVADLKTTRKK